MRILHILGGVYLPRDPGTQGTSGVVNAVLSIAQAQVARGHKVWVAAVDHQRWALEWHGVKLVCLKLAPWAQLRLGTRRLDLRLQWPLMMVAHKQDFDVIQGHFHHYLRFLRAPTRIVHVHIDPFHTGTAGSDISMKTADFATVVRYSQAQVAVSRYVAEQLQIGLGRQGNIHVVYNGVDSERFKSELLDTQRQYWRGQWGAASHDVVFLYAGAIVPEKGVHHLIAAFAQMCKRNPSAKLVVAGDMAMWKSVLESQPPGYRYEGDLRLMLSEAWAQGRVKLMGRVAWNRMPEVYAASDVVVIPSVWGEPFPLVALEALAAGRPVIASAVGGLPELINHQNGLLVKAASVPELEQAMLALLSDPLLRLQLGVEGRSQMRAFTWARAARELDRLYQALHTDKQPLAGSQGLNSSRTSTRS